MRGSGTKFNRIVNAMRSVLTDTGLTIKLRTGIYTGKNTAAKMIPQLKLWNVDLITLHGRSKEMRCGACGAG
jgi:tRNA-dihydrouridine synthase